jgi:probable F420-dependent oxidoreductase
MRPLLSTGLVNFAADDPGDWTHLLEQAEILDRVGFDRIAISDHVVLGEHLDEYARPEVGGQAGGKQPTGPDGHWLEPLTTLSVIAGRTQRIRLSTNILIAALRRPVVLAKTASTLDVLSGGRLDLGVGVGWQREEYVAAGVEFDGRGKLLDETLGICRSYWTNMEVDGIHMMPKPVQPGGVPIWVSGRINPMVVRRLAAFGAGWIPWGDEANTLIESVPRMKNELEKAGRDPSDIGVVGYLKLHKAGSGWDLAATMAAVPDMVELGITDFRVNFRMPDHGAEEILTPLVEAFRNAT